MRINHYIRFFAACSLIVLIASSCSTPEPGPDKTLGGAALGAAWGAGAGAIIGNQMVPSVAGEGAAIGAGFGLVAGAASGMTYDAVEDTQLMHEKQLASLKIQNITNAQELARLQDKLDGAIHTSLAGGVYQVFFDEDATSLRGGAIANLEVIADSIKSSPHSYTINVVGHTDDAGDLKYNDNLAESRARAVSAYLASRGISSLQIKVESFGAKRPIASNTTPVGRQLNRRVDVYISNP